MPESASAVAALAQEAWDLQMRESPLQATFYGDHRYDDRLEERGAAARGRRLAALKDLLGRAAKVPEAGLGEEDAITLDVLRWMLRQQIDSFEHRFWEWDLNQLNGLHMELQDFLLYHPRDTEKGARDLVTRLRAVPAVFDQVRGDLRDGLRSGRVMPEVAYGRILAQLREFVAAKPSETPFGQAARLPESFPAPARAALETDLRRAVEEAVHPAYGGFLRFLEKEYAGKARAAVGLGSLPGGAAAYAYKVAWETTTDLAPDRIHAIGLEELEGNRAEMLEIARRHGHRGDLRSYLDSLRDDPRFRMRTREDLIGRFREILARMEKELPRAFGILPRTPYRVEPMQAFQEKDGPGAYYYPPATDGSRPGVFFANTYDAPSWPTYEMETLAYHEAVPGHHLQIAIAQERTGLPMFRRNAPFTAYVEGWAHYAERLADEMGMFSTDEDRIGMLAGQAWRAARLVVDTGMHHLGWTRERALELLRSIKTGPDKDVGNEVDRYIVWPGQALAYKVGHRRIRELREGARKRLGARFDLRDFHDEVLRHGALPLATLEGAVERWVAARAGG